MGRRQSVRTACGRPRSPRLPPPAPYPSPALPLRAAIPAPSAVRAALPPPPPPPIGCGVAAPQAWASSPTSASSWAWLQQVLPTHPPAAAAALPPPRCACCSSWRCRRRLACMRPVADGLQARASGCMHPIRMMAYARLATMRFPQPRVAYRGHAPVLLQATDPPHPLLSIRPPCAHARWTPSAPALPSSLCPRCARPRL